MEATERRVRAVDRVTWAVAWVLLVAVLAWSLVLPPSGASLFPGADQAGHALLYLALTGSWLLAAVWRPGRGFGRWPLGAPGIVVGFAAMGAAIELIQPALHRRAELLDALADLGGVVAGALLWRGLWSRALHRSSTDG